MGFGPPPRAYLLDPNIFDASKNCDFTWWQEDGQTYERENQVYNFPIGWSRIALNIEGKYDEWPTAYHGRQELFHDILLAEEEDHEEEEEGHEEEEEGRKSKREMGFYTAPDPLVAEESAPIFTFKSRNFKVMIQSRVNMNDTDTAMVGVGHNDFYATKNQENIISGPVDFLLKACMNSD